MKILVIGGGLAGVQTAYFLLQDGHDVTLVERGDAFSLETSFANGGMISPAAVIPWNSPGIFKTLINSIGKKDSAIHVKFSALGQYLGWGRQFVRNSTPKRYHRTIERNFTLAQYSQQCLRQLRSDLPLDFFHASNGTMMVFDSEASRKDGLRQFDDLTRHGVNAQICDTKEVIKLEPSLAPNRNKITGGIYFPDDEHGNAREFTQSLAQYLTKNGVKMLLNTDVRDFITHGNKISGVKTNKGDILADKFVMAAGLWSTDLLKSLGISLPIRPVKGTSLTYQLPQWKDGPKMPVLDEDLHVVVTPLGQSIRVAGTAEFCGFDPVVRPERIALLRRGFLKVFPQVENILTEVEPELEWSGHRPMTPDCMPILGGCDYENLYLNTGHGYLGWTTGTGTSQAIADMITGRKPELDISNYDLNRF